MGYLTTEEIESNFIDDRNRELWDRLNRQYQILVSDIYQYYRLDFVTGSDEVRIHVNTKSSSALFTHELLHLELREKGLNTFDYFKRSDNQIIETSMVTICNCLEHVLFFDEYIEMGFKKEDFTMDYKTSIIDFPTIIKSLKDALSIRKNLYTLLFYYFYWIIKAEEYTGHFREQELLKLKDYDSPLFSRCESMFNKVIEFDLEDSCSQVRFEGLMSEYLKRSY